MAMSTASAPPGAKTAYFMPGDTLISDFGQRRARHRRKPVIADVEIIERALQRLDEFGMAVAEIVGAAIQMQVDQPAPDMS